MKRNVIILFCLIALMPVLSQTITQQGVAYRYNGKQQRTPLGNVTIQYDANKRTALSGEDNGTFTLLLDGRKMGDRIGLVTIKKREMMVFNQHAVDEWSIRKEPLMLILCNADEFERQKENLINIGRLEAKKKYDRQKAELEAKLNEGKIKLAEKEAALDKAYEELERLQTNIGEFADALARIDQSELDEQMSQILTLYEGGNVEKAMKMLDDMRLGEKFVQALERKQYHEQGVKFAVQDSIALLNGLRSSIELYKTNGEWDKAAELMKLLADKLQTPSELFKYAFFCQEYMVPQAEIYYQKVINATAESKEWDINHLYLHATSLNNLGGLYFGKGDFDASDNYFLQALEERKRYAELSNNPNNEGHVAWSLVTFASSFKSRGQFEKSKKCLDDANEIYNKIVSINPDEHEWAYGRMLFDYSLLYQQIGDSISSKSYYLRAYDIYKKLSVEPPKGYGYEPNTADLLNQFAISFKGIGWNDECIQLCEMSIDIYKKLNNRRYDSNIADNYELLASVFLGNDNEKTICCLKKALDIRRRLAEINPQTYEPDMTMTIANLAAQYFQIQNYKEAEPMLKEALELYRGLAKSKPQEYDIYVVITLNYIAEVYLCTNRPKESVVIHKEALEFCRNRAQSNPQTYNPHMAISLGCLSFNYIFMKQFVEAEQYACEGLAVDSTQHWIASNLAAALLFQGKTAEAEKLYRQYKDELKDGFLDDFKRFAEAGVIPKEREADVERIKRILEE